MTVEFVPPSLPSPLRVLILGSATAGWYEAGSDEQGRALGRFKDMISEWLSLGARCLATLDDDLFMVGESATTGFTWYLMFEVERAETVVAMLQAVRASVDGVRMDRYVRFEARMGRPFFMLEA